MFSNLWSALQKPASRRPQRSRSTSRRLGVETLEDRALPSGGPGGGLVSPSGSTPGGSGSQPAAVLTQSGGPGSSSGGSISGPGYPLPPSSGPSRPDPGTLDPTTSTAVLVPLTGTPGGPDPTLAVVPIVTG
jgi:hypothetical protein